MNVKSNPSIPPPVNFCWSAMRVDFFIKFYFVEQQNIYFMVKFCWNTVTLKWQNYAVSPKIIPISQCSVYDAELAASEHTIPAWLPVVVTSSIYSNSVRLQICILVLSPTNKHFSEPPTYRVKTTLGKLRNRELSLLKHNFIIFRCLSTQLNKIVIK